MRRHQALQNLSVVPSPDTFEGVVQSAPADRLDVIGVAYAGSPDVLAIETDMWPRDGDNLPQVGDAVHFTVSPPGVTVWRPSA